MKPAVGQIASLTGLRFVAAFAVFVHHMANRFGVPQFRVALGALGVSFFFVLSGFILTYVYDGRLKKDGIRRFYFTRFARIWPLHFVTLLMVLFLVGQWFVGFDIRVLLGNLLLIQSWIPDNNFTFSMNNVAWSISTEMFFYVMFPLLLLGGQRKFWFKFAGVAFLIALALYLLQGLERNPTTASKFDFLCIIHTNPLIRLFEFCLGMGTGFLFLNRKTDAKAINTSVDSVFETMAIVAVAAVSVAFAYYRPDRLVQSASWGGYVYSTWLTLGVNAFVFAFAIFVFASRLGWWGRVLSCDTMVVLGESSFAFYMIHMIVIRLVTRYDWLEAYIPNWSIVLCIFLVCVCASILLYKVVELPCKSALLKFYDGNWSAGLAAILSSPIEFLSTRLGVASVATLALALFTLSVGHRPADVPEVESAIINSKEPSELVAFESVARINGALAERNEQGIKLTISWQKTSYSDMSRFVHVYDASGKLLSSKRKRLWALNDLDVGEIFDDTIQLDNDVLKLGAFVGVGFSSQDAVIAKLISDTDTPCEWRYTILDQREIASLIAAPIATTAELNRENARIE